MVLAAALLHGIVKDDLTTVPAIYAYLCVHVCVCACPCACV